MTWINYFKCNKCKRQLEKDMITGEVKGMTTLKLREEDIELHLCYECREAFEEWLDEDIK